MGDGDDHAWEACAGAHIKISAFLELNFLGWEQGIIEMLFDDFALFGDGSKVDLFVPLLQESGVFFIRLNDFVT